MDTREAGSLNHSVEEQTEPAKQSTPLSPFSPAWERERPSLKSAAITIWQVLRYPTRTFKAPRSPNRNYAIGFGIVLGTFWATLDLMDVAPFHDDIAINYSIVALCLAVSPFFVWGLIYIEARITHLLLEMVGSGSREFNKTYRVAAYVGGAVAIFSAVPLLGDIIGWFVWLVLMVYALAAAHGLPKRRVILPVIVMGFVFPFLVFLLLKSC
jgi:hypothetical protein